MSVTPTSGSGSVPWSPWTGVCIGGGSMFATDPGWDRLDAGHAGLRCSGVSIRRGRQSMWEKTDTGTCTATFNDRSGVLDPTGSDITSKPFAVSIRNPVTGEWAPLFRGVVDDVAVSVDRSMKKQEVTIQAVDMQDYLANVALIPEDPDKVTRQGYVLFEFDDFRSRIEAALAYAKVTNTDLFSVFSGNTVIADAQYSAGDTVMQVIEEACDAEFPQVANYYVDVRGVLQVHGRYARFTPDEVAAGAAQWDFTRWKVGTNTVCQSDPSHARLVEPYTLNESRSEIRNLALAYPAGVDQQDLYLYIVEDAASRSQHGTRTWTAPNLALYAETTLGLTPKNYCRQIATWIVENYKDPVPRIPQVTVGTVRPDHDAFSATFPHHTDYGPATWDYICGTDISDVVTVAGLPGGGDYYVEGVSIDLAPGPGSLDDAFPLVTHTADLSSADHWAENPFT